MKKTLGGDRIGTGKKMQVELDGYQMSTHDLSTVSRTSMSPGTLVPFLCEVAVPADTWDLELFADVKTHPTIGPLFGSFKLQLDVYCTPMRLYNSLLHMNAVGIGLSMTDAKIPQIEMFSIVIDNPDDIDLNGAQINSSSIMAYLGLRGIGLNAPAAPAKEGRLFNAIPLLTYWDIYNNYYSNKQEKKGAVIHCGGMTPTSTTIDNLRVFTPVAGTFDILEYPAVSQAFYMMDGYEVIAFYTGTAPDPKQVMINTTTQGSISLYDFCGGVIIDSGTGLAGTYDYQRWGQVIPQNYNYLTSSQPVTIEPRVELFDLTNIDDMKKEILGYTNTTAPFKINDANGGTGITPYLWVYDQPNDMPNILCSQEGLGIKTYQSDLFNNWLDTAYISAINTASAVSTSTGSFTIDSLNLARKVYELLNRVAVSGGTFNDWIDSVYDMESRRRAESPMYMGGLQSEVVFQEVVSNAAATAEPLGSLAGKGRLSENKRGGKVKIKIDEPCTIMGIASLTPRIDYSQGNRWYVHLQTFDDFHKPQLDQIGFQDLITEEMAWWATEFDGTNWIQTSAGKQPAWISYMSNVNRTYGNFAEENSEMFMTLNRRYERDSANGGIQDLTTYIDPSKYNFIFAQTQLDAQNFWVQIGVNMNVRRKMSAKIMPSL